jgi:hypothetical protein
MVTAEFVHRKVVETGDQAGDNTIYFFTKAMMQKRALIKIIIVGIGPMREHSVCKMSAPSKGFFFNLDRLGIRGTIIVTKELQS